MLVHELNEDECGEVLERSSLGRLACSRFDQPYIVPIHFAFDAERRCLYAFSTIGQKIDWMRENPKICLEVDDVSDKNHWTSVVVVGWYEEIHQNPAEAEARRRAERLLQQRPQWWFPAAAKLPLRERHEMVLYRLNIDRMTGRRAARTPNGSA